MKGSPEVDLYTDYVGRDRVGFTPEIRTCKVKNPEIRMEGVAIDVETATDTSYREPTSCDCQIVTPTPSDPHSVFTERTRLQKKEQIHVLQGVLTDYSTS